MKYLVTGANRGIGLEFTTQLLKRGDVVMATARQPEEADQLQQLADDHGDRLQVVQLDVTDETTIDDLADRVSSQAIDVLINNAGTMIGSGSFEELDERAVFDSVDVNTLGPLRVSRAVLPALERTEQPKIVNVTSKMGSVADNESGGSYAYRISKAALNMATRSMAIDLQQRGIVAFVIHPGWVETRMGGPNALIDTETSVDAMLTIIDDADSDTSGTFQEWNGDVVPW